MKRYVITGGLGFIGSHLADRLSESADVFVIDDGRTSVVDSLPNVTIIRHDLTWADWPDDVDGIFHLAGPVGPVGVLEWAGKIVPAVVDAAARVRQEAILNDCPLVYVSTSEVYGEQQQPVDEGAPRIIAAGASARMEYAVAKLAAETMLLNADFLDVRIIRPFNVAGPRQSERGGFVIPRFIRQAKAGEPITVYAGPHGEPGSQMRAFTHVYDIVDGIVRAMRMGQKGAVYNLGNERNACTILELAQEVKELVGSSSEIQFVDPTEIWGLGFKEAADKIPYAKRAMRELVWRPMRTRAQVIMDAAAHG